MSPLLITDNTKFVPHKEVGKNVSCHFYVYFLYIHVNLIQIKHRFTCSIIKLNNVGECFVCIWLSSSPDGRWRDMSGKDNFLLVAAIDLGTAYSGYAFSMNRARLKLLLYFTRSIYTTNLKISKSFTRTCFSYYFFLNNKLS